MFHCVAKKRPGFRIYGEPRVENDLWRGERANWLPGMWVTFRMLDKSLGFMLLKIGFADVASRKVLLLNFKTFSLI